VKRKTVCIYVDAELVEELTKAAKEQEVSLSALVEDALRLYVLYVLRRPEPRRGRAKKANREPPTGKPHREVIPAGNPCEPSLQSCPQQAPPQLPPHLQNNAWIAVLRSRR